MGLYIDADLEAHNALDILVEPTQKLQSAVLFEATGNELLDPLTAWIDSISAFAKRCKAAGSSALQ